MLKYFIITFTCLLILILMAMLTGCSSGGKTISDDDIAVSWNDTSMTVVDFKAKMLIRFTTESNARKQPLEERFKVLDEQIVRSLKIAEGYRLGFDQHEDIRKSYNETLKRAAIGKLYNLKVRDNFLTDEMVRDFWEHDRYEVHCRHILIEMSEDVDGRDTLAYWNRINEVYEKAKEGESFKRLVRKHSEDRSTKRKNYGDIGFFTWSKMVDEFQRAAWVLESGEISPPVRTRYGYHIIKMIEKRSLELEVNTSHILVKVNRRASSGEETAARERAMMILEEAKKPGVDFNELARRYSEDNKTWVNGIVGWVPRGSMPSDYWEKALTMKKGEIDGPVRSYKGYHIIKLNDIRVAEHNLDDPEESESIKSRIAQIHNDTLNAIYESYLESVKEQFAVKYNRDVIKIVAEKFGGKSTSQDINTLITLKPDEKDLLVVEDNLGGMNIQELIDLYGNYHLPLTFGCVQGPNENLVEQILIQRYLSKLARREGFFDDPEVLAEGKKALENTMLPVVEQEIIFNNAIPIDEEVKDYYENHIDEFTEAPTATVYEIMVDDKRLAEELRVRIDKGEKIYKLARRYTQRKKAKRRSGKLGPFTRDQYGPVSREAFELEKREIAGPIKTDEMYSIIQLRETTPEKVKALNEVRNQIESNLRFERQMELKNNWIEELKKKYKVKVHKSVIKRVWPIIEPLPDALIAERKSWLEKREEVGKRVARKSKTH